MVGETTEDEQVEVLKKWINENGLSVVVSIVVVMTVVFGYRTWETQTRETAEAASAVYEDLVAALTVGPLGTVSAENLSTGGFLADQLKTDYTGSTYAQFAAMYLAKLAVEDGDLALAATELQWAVDNGKNEKIAIITNLRLARVQFELKEYESAVAQLENIEPGAHKSSYEELRGDIYYAMGRIDDSREAYQRAVNLQTENVKPMTRIKLNDLVVPKIELLSGEADDMAGNEKTGEEQAGMEENGADAPGGSDKES